jgi:predicted metal-binding membrane protein
LINLLHQWRLRLLLVVLGDTVVDEVQPFSLQRNVILGLLLALATAAWATLLWRNHDVSVDLTMVSPIAWGLHILLFLAMWVVMMVAMMLPTAAPMILAFHSVQARNHQPDDAFRATWVFMAAYLLVWALSGIAAYTGALAAAAVHPALADEVSGLILMVAGIYQITPLKQRCLSECRRPIIMTSWYHRTADAFHMGLLHGVYCLGCCWLLFVILFPLDILEQWPLSLSSYLARKRCDGPSS